VLTYQNIKFSKTQNVEYFIVKF